MEAPWEALDVDDSDLPSLLRPCKRLHHHLSTSAAATTTTSTSSHSQPIYTINDPVAASLHSSQQPLLRSCLQSKTLINSSHSQHHDSPPPPPLPSSSSQRLIPGPAGAVQAAMLRKIRDDQNLSFREEPPVPTQEYIRKAVENAEEDDDFTRNPWLCALEFLRQNGAVDGVLPTTLKSIKKCLDAGKLDQVVVVIKSCTPNGLGDLMVTLKDPTGTAGGSIHRKVLTECAFAKDISVGSVLILQKVAVFAPSLSAHYLNIMPNNVSKVFSKDSGPPVKQNNCAYAANKNASETDCRDKAAVLQKVFFPERRPEQIIVGVRQHNYQRGSALHSCHVERRDPYQYSSICSDDASRNETSAAGEELLLEGQNCVIDSSVNPVSMNTADYVDDPSVVDNITGKSKELSSDSVPQKGGTTKLSKNCISTQDINGVLKQRPQLKSKASLPQWTDEQLNELFALEDDDNLF